MTKMEATAPEVPAYEDPRGKFTTDVEYLGGPGFFPVHSGRIVADGLAAVEHVFFGSDWGPVDIAKTCREEMAERGMCSCARGLRPQSERRRDRRSGDRWTATECRLFDALSNVEGLDLRSVVLRLLAKIT